MTEKTARHLVTRMSQLPRTVGAGTEHQRPRRVFGMSASKMAAVNGENVVEETKAKTRGWSRDEELTLLQNVENHLQSSEKGKDIYVKDIAWGKITFGEFDEDDVHRRWNALTSKIRKMRTVNEILEDAKLKVAEKDDSVKSRKRKRDDKDPAFPKTPLTSYLIFCEEKRPRLAQKYTDLGSKELMTKLAKKWQKLSDQKKQKYQDIYVENRKKFDHDITQYFIEHYPDEKPPKTAFNLWSESKEKEIKKDRPDISEKKLKKKVKKYWEKLEDSEKEHWEKKAKSEVSKYIKRMKKKVKI